MSYSDWFKQKSVWGKAGHTADHKLMNVPSMVLNANSAATGLVGATGKVTPLQGYKLNPLAMTVMANPPSVGISTTNVLSTGLFYSSVNTNPTSPGVGNPSISFFRGGYYRLDGSVYPGYMFVSPDTFSQGFPSTYATNSIQYSFLHTGSKFVLFTKGNGGKLLIKVNDQFVSLTPLTFGNDGNLYYVLVDFGSVNVRRIDLLGQAVNLGGIYTEQVDSVSAAPRRGPRTVVLGDSFGEGTGNESATIFSWINYLSEYLGWDDVIASAVGSTGLIAGTLPKVPFAARAARDVAGLNPQLVWVSLSINDSGSNTAAALLAAAKNLVTVINGAGCYPNFVFSSPTINKGAGWVSAQVAAQELAIKTWCQQSGYTYVSDLEMPLDTVYSIHTTTLSAAASAGATTVATVSPLTPGATYKFADGTRVFARSGILVDNISQAQSSGATLTQCGPVYLTGGGNVSSLLGFGSADACVCNDGTHPTNRGHKLKGFTDANLFLLAQ